MAYSTPTPNVSAAGQVPFVFSPDQKTAIGNIVTNVEIVLFGRNNQRSFPPNALLEQRNLANAPVPFLKNQTDHVIFVGDLGG